MLAQRTLLWATSPMYNALVVVSLLLFALNSLESGPAAIHGLGPPECKNLEALERWMITCALLNRYISLNLGLHRTLNPGQSN